MRVPAIIQNAMWITTHAVIQWFTGRVLLCGHLRAGRNFSPWTFFQFFEHHNFEDSHEKKQFKSIKLQTKADTIWTQRYLEHAFEHMQFEKQLSLGSMPCSDNKGLGTLFDKDCFMNCMCLPFVWFKHIKKHVVHLFGKKTCTITRVEHGKCYNAYLLHID